VTEPEPTTAPTTERGAALSSVDNALWLMSLVAKKRVLRVADAARELGVARSTAYRLLNSLKSHGFVRQEKPNGPYRPGGALIELGLSAIGRTNVRRIARPVMDQLREDTYEMVSIASLDGNQVRILDDLESPLAVRIASRTGRMVPAHLTAVGKALLAALPEDELTRRYPDHDLEGHSAASITDWDILMAELHEIRVLGYAVSRGENETSLSAVAVVVPDATGYPIAAIGIVVPSTRFDVDTPIEQYAVMLQHAAEEVHDLLAARVPTA
jgi:DNA-binding IclR family transcriptional regulator